MSMANRQNLSTVLETFFHSKHAKLAALILSALILLAIFMPNSFQNLQQAAPFGAQIDTDQPAQRTPDSFGKNMLLQTFSTDGSVRYQVEAASMQQYLVDKSTDLQEPSITLNNPDSPPWIIKAKSGVISSTSQNSNIGESKKDKTKSEKLVSLQGTVSVTQYLSGEDYVRMRSEKLSVYPNLQTAHTKQMVIVETPIFRTQALGVYIDLANGRIEFPKNSQQRVRSTLAPTPTPTLEERI